jgi:hypothetical protein
MMDRIAKGPEDVKKSVRAADELPLTRMTYGVFYRRSSAFIGATTGFALERLRDAKRVYEKTTRGRARDAR